MKKELSVKSQSVETSGITKDYKEALCEYIWNGFEANATTVSISFTCNDLGGIETVIIEDNGEGICYDTIDDTFGTFLASKKASLSMQLKSKSNKGKGRFSCYAFAAEAQWDTVVDSKDGLLSYFIRINSENKSEFEISDPQVSKSGIGTGTKVTISRIFGLLQSDMESEILEDALLKAFAWYLYLNRNKGVQLLLNGAPIDYKKYINATASITENVKIDDLSFSITLIVWAEKIRENFCSYYLDSSGVLCGKDTTTFNRNTINFNHSVYVQSAFFNEKENISLTTPASDIDGQIYIDETERAMQRKLKKKIHDLIGKQMDLYMAGQADKAVAAMEARKSFPHFGDDVYEQMRKKDLVQVTKAMYCYAPRIFHNLKDVQEKSLLGMLNLILNTDERENVLSIIENIVDLTPNQREEFAIILKRTTLGNIVDTIKFIEDRYRIIETLRRIVYDFAEYSNERDHVQKIIEQHYWLFGEQYNLVTSDQRMQTALTSYLYLLYGDSKPNAVLQPDEESMRRMDIFTCGKRVYIDGAENDIEENLIIELKAPRVKLTKAVLRQTEDYMDFIRRQPQFNSLHRTWKFVAVCNELDDDVKSRRIAQKEKGKLGLVTQIENYEVYALTWDDVFKGFELRHRFLLDKLKVDQAAIAAELNEKIDGKESRATVDALVAATAPS